MRSGPPDSLDRLVAKNFAGLAEDLILAGKTGRLVAIQNGRYTTAYRLSRCGGSGGGHAPPPGPYQAASPDFSP